MLRKVPGPTPRVPRTVATNPAPHAIERRSEANLQRFSSAGCPILIAPDFGAIRVGIAHSAIPDQDFV